MFKNFTQDVEKQTNFLITYKKNILYKQEKIFPKKRNVFNSQAFFLYY
jgi:hypothetical protein